MSEEVKKTLNAKDAAAWLTGMRTWLMSSGLSLTSPFHETRKLDCDEAETHNQRKGDRKVGISEITAV